MYEWYNHSGNEFGIMGNVHTSYHPEIPLLRHILRNLTHLCSTWTSTSEDLLSKDLLPGVASAVSQQPLATMSFKVNFNCREVAQGHTFFRTADHA